MKRIFTFFFLIVELYFAVVVCGNFAARATKNLLVPHWNQCSPALEMKLYPQPSSSQEADIIVNEQTTDLKQNQFLAKIGHNITAFSRKADYCKEVISYILEDGAPYYQAAVIASRYCDKLTGKNVTTAIAGTADPATYEGEDLVFEADDGFFTHVSVGSRDDGIAEAERSLSLFVRFVKELRNRDIPLLFLETGGKYPSIGKYYPMYADLYPDYTEEVVYTVLSGIKEAGIDCANVGEAYPEILQEPEKYFFRSDHHWLPQTGLLACRVLAEALNEKYGYDIDPDIFNLENYDDSYKMKMLGSTGKAATEAYCKPETISFLMPKYESNLDVYYLDGNRYFTGSIEDTLFAFENSKNSDPYSRFDYEVYGYGNQPLISIHNNLVHNGKKLLMIKLSMASCMVPYMAGVVEDMDVIDPRRYSGNIFDYIDESKPDTVVIIFGAASFDNARTAFDCLMPEE